MLHLLVVGLPNKLIAEQLHIHEKTVKVHVTHLFEKSGASNRVVGEPSRRDT